MLSTRRTAWVNERSTSLDVYGEYRSKEILMGIEDRQLVRVLLLQMALAECRGEYHCTTHLLFVSPVCIQQLCYIKNYPRLLEGSVTRWGDLLHFGQLFKA